MQAIAGLDVLEVGSFDVNGSVRSAAKQHSPGRYVGVDIAPGPGVDVVCSAEDLVKTFGEASFDVVVTTEMLEHVPNWKSAIMQMKQVLRPGGRLILTTRSRGPPMRLRCDNPQPRERSGSSVPSAARVCTVEAEYGYSV